MKTWRGSMIAERSPLPSSVPTAANEPHGSPLIPAVVSGRGPPPTRGNNDKWLSFDNHCRKEHVLFVVYVNLKCALEKTDWISESATYTYHHHNVFSIGYYCYVQTPEKWVFREREKGVEKDGAWKNGQTLVSQVFAWKQTPASRTHPFFFCPLRNMGQRLVKTLWRLFPTGGAIVGPNFESRKNPFNSGMDHVQSLKGQGLGVYEVVVLSGGF